MSVTIDRQFGNISINEVDANGEGVGEVTLDAQGGVFLHNSEVKGGGAPYEVLVKQPGLADKIRAAAQAAKQCGQFGEADQIIHGLLPGKAGQKDGRDSLIGR